MTIVLLLCAAFVLSIATVPVEDTVPVEHSMNFVPVEETVPVEQSMALERPEDPVMEEIPEEELLTEARSRMICGIKESSNKCPPGWFEHGSRCFIFVNREMSWADAEIYCMSSGANLVSIHTPMEHALIQELVKNQTGTFTQAWIGGTDAVKTWQWFWSDGSRFFYYDWARGQPDNHLGREKCIAMNFSDEHLWNDQNCEDRRSFICGTRPNGPC